MSKGKSRRKPQPAGAIETAASKPPTAVATVPTVATTTASPAPEYRPAARPRPMLFDLISRTLDVVDELGDMIAAALRFRPS